jgi:hypothetical protein
MRLLIYIVVAVLGGVAVLVGIMALIGSQLPKNHVASRSIFLRKSPQDVYAVIRDFASTPKWRAGVKQVDVDGSPDGRVYFREVAKHGTVNYELIDDVPGQRMATKIRDTDLGFGGQWTYTLVAQNGGTRVTIREDGEVSNVLFRFMSRYIFGQTSTIDSYLTSLASHFGEQAVLQ